MNHGRQPSATEWRKRVAHGVSRGEKCAIAKNPVRARELPELRPKRIFFRRYAARMLTSLPTSDAVLFV